MNITCPHCKQSFALTQGGRRPKRWCAKCEKPIERHDKFVINDDGRMEHRHCDRPESYV